MARTNLALFVRHRPRERAKVRHWFKHNGERCALVRAAFLRLEQMKIRCAIYTRKSTDEGLDQEFNSLDAQFEACGAYIASQKHEGWKQLPRRYDDGGISGGTLERPGRQQLLTDIDAGRVDMVVVYKVDRLTRSLADFAKLVERMEAADCSFVSVTQSFNTSSSMGRLTLNMLLSFAQFEREVTAERIRDSLSVNASGSREPSNAASKRKGLWMGGLAPLGYDPHPDKLRRELVVNEEEAAIVLRLFQIYLETGCLNASAATAKTEVLRSKRRTFTSGRTQGGTPLSRGQIHATLTNPVYRGLIRHKDQTFPGAHPSIIDADLWDQVQTKLQAASAKRRGKSQDHGSAAPLLGKFRDETGDRLTPTHTNKKGRRIRYYVSNGLVSGKPRPDAWRLPAKQFEGAVAGVVVEHLARHAQLRSVSIDGSANAMETASQRAEALAQRINRSGIQAVAHCIADGAITRDTINIHLEASAVAASLDLEQTNLNPALLAVRARFTCRRRGQETKIIAGEAKPQPDQTLVKALRNAHAWAEALKSGTPIKEIAHANRCSDSYARRVVPLATLSPKLQSAILDGTLPDHITVETFIRSNIPLDWQDQEARFGTAI